MIKSIADTHALIWYIFNDPRLTARVNEMMGEALDANGRREDATAYYQKALTLAKTVEPTFQASLVASLDKRLAATPR